MDFDQKLAFFRELICCGHELYLSVFDPALRVVSSNCPFADHIPALLSLAGDADRFDFLSGFTSPAMLSGKAELLWILDRGIDGEEPRCFYLLGPVFIEDVAAQRLETAVTALGITGGEKRELVQQLAAAPMLPINHFLDYGLMLHYSLTGEHLDAGTFRFVDREEAASPPQEADRQRSSHGTWAMEQELLRLIEEGNPDYRKRAARLVGRGKMMPLGGGSTLRHIKNSVIIFTALCTRSAIRGGMSPEAAYTLSDRYINRVESAGSFEEVANLNRLMQDDFVQRVRDSRVSGDSPMIQRLRQYLDTHPEQTPVVPELAAELGYSPSHLAREFKKQTGQTIQQYLRSRRIELARLALRSSGESVQSICHRLGFSSQSYFAAEFRKAVGLTPTAYRQRNGLV